jgi:demethylmenaquinone methyltransferase/2-methoxy-6-polyprenyl-1,4-benzoquinol methylase
MNAKSRGTSGLYCDERAAYAIVAGLTDERAYRGPEAAKIRAMFRSIAGRYDRANTILSGGIHHLWRTRAVRWSEARPGDRILDCATGTGDLAIAFQRAVGERGEVIGTDFVPEMLDLARLKSANIRFEVADVTALPYADGSFDVASISFGIRNVQDPVRAVSELARVVKPGGRVIILEFGQPPNRLVSTVYDGYRKHVLPRIGAAVTGERGAYEYLETSAGRFPSGAAFVDLMRSAAQFSAVDYIPLTFGVAYLYKGVR